MVALFVDYTGSSLQYGPARPCLPWAAWEIGYARETRCARRAASARQEAQRTRAAADKAARHVAAVVQSLERKGALEEVIDLDLTYREQREGLQQVQTLRDDRLGEIDASKEEAVSLVHEAMQRLESLSNELHEQSGDSPARGNGNGTSEGKEGAAESEQGAADGRDGEPRL